MLFDIKPNSLLLQSTYCHRDCVTLGDKVVKLLSNCEIKSKTIYCLCLLAIILSIYLYCNVRTIQKGGTSRNEFFINSLMLWTLCSIHKYYELSSLYLT